MKCLLLACITLAACTQTTPPPDPIRLSEPPPTADMGEDLRPDHTPDMEILEDMTAPVEHRWVGIEVVGHTSTSRDALTQDPPLELGALAPPVTDQAARRRQQAWGDALATELGLPYINVGVVRFIEGDTYLVVNVVEEEELWRLDKRDPPTSPRTLSSQELRDTFERFEQVFWSRFFDGPQEALEQRFDTDALGAYLNYPKDETLRALVQKMRELAPTHREELLEIAGEASSTQERAMAVRLLTWGGSLDDSLQRVTPLLDDPSSLVRNNIGLFMIQFMEHTQTPPTRVAIADALLEMHTGASHADRNKSVLGLLELARLFPEHRAYIRTHPRLVFLERTAAQSVLSNVQEPARELLELLRE